MNLNPCLRCPLKNKDKNNDTCKECSKRVNYVKLIDESPGYGAPYAPETFTFQVASNIHY